MSDNLLPPSGPLFGWISICLGCLEGSMVNLPRSDRSLIKAVYAVSLTVTTILAASSDGSGEPSTSTRVACHSPCRWLISPADAWPDNLLRRRFLNWTVIGGPA